MCQTSVFDVRIMASFDWPSAGHQFSHKINVWNKDRDVRNKDNDVRNKDNDVRNKDSDVRNKDNDVRNKDSDVWNRDKIPVLIPDIDL